MRSVVSLFLTWVLLAVVGMPAGCRRADEAASNGAEAPSSAPTETPTPGRPIGASPTVGDALGQGTGPLASPGDPGIEPRMLPEAGDPAAVPPAGDPLSATPTQRRGKHSGEPIDPIKENGPIFVDWPKPKLALVITGRQEGYMEPCGCAGLDRMRGGMSRRHTMFRQLREKGWPVVGIDAGSVAKGFGRQAELKFHTMVESLRKMDYDVVNLGGSDLHLPAGELVSVAAGVDGQPSVFLSANVGLFGFDAGLTARSKVVERAGMRIGVTGVIGRAQRTQVHNDEVELADAEAVLPDIVADLKRKADYLVLLSDATKEESIALGKKFPDFHLIVTTGGAAEPPSRPETIEGTGALLVEVGEKGMDAVVLAFFDDEATPWRYQRVPLDSRFPASPDMHLLMAAYQDQLKAMGLSGLAIRPVPHPQRETGGRFVGSEECASCHETSHRIWRRSGHAKAWQTLVELDPPRTHDPECISCHVVGWHPTKYYPYEGGFLSEETTPHLTGVGCESCHGPGENHVQAEMGSDLALQEQMRKAVVVTKEESRERQCYSCHDLDNSPDFDFESYWPLVEHYEDE